MKSPSTILLAKKAAAIGLFSLFSTFASAAIPQHPWAAMAQADADFVTDWIMGESISAIYPSKDVFAARLAKARRVFDAESIRATGYEGYREALGHFVGSLQDQHLSVQFGLAPVSYNWPGFLVVYRGGRYLTLPPPASGVSEQEITACDGKPMDAWTREVATYQQFALNLESTKARAAPLVFRDAGSPFVSRPEVCNIGGQDVKLNWLPVNSSEFSKEVAAATVLRDRVTAVTPFGPDGAWVRMGIFQPETQAEGKSFKKLIADAPALRDKSVIVLDIRGNGGGPYEWCLGFLRSLYGRDYVDYYARARLQIANVYRTTPAILTYFNSDNAAQVDDLSPPSDGTPFDADNAMYRRALETGKPLFFTPSNARAVPRPKDAPVNVVKARLLVLTDYYCGSVCIAFVDELKRFPGVEQIGVETGVDSHTGTPFGAPLPSGNGVINVPVMTRDGRERGDNIPQRPDRVFKGNIIDTAAVKAWVQAEIAGQGNGARAVH